MTELYEDLPSFSNFTDLSRQEHYARLPSDWNVIIAYVVNAEEATNYRDVNNMSGGCVTAVKNSLNGRQIPYVFTGDGASFAVPPCCYEQAVGALLAFRKIVQRNFDSDLCIGSMTVGEIEEQSQTHVEVARYEIAHGVCIGLFRGGGMAYANTQVGRVGNAGEESKIADDAVPPVQAALDGLSCRWTPMPSKFGNVLSIIVYENPDRPNSGVYDDVLHEVDCILDFNRSNPAHMDRSSFKSFSQMMKDDRKFHTTRCSLSYLARFAEMCLGIVVYRWGILKNLVFNSQYYKYSQREHADYRKFDDMLRMVVDCTVDQAKALEFVLQDRYNQGHLFYGIFSSSHAVMTCLLEGLEDGQHIHFMDGADGGYTMAAKALREQMDSAMKLKPRRATGWSAPSSTALDEELGWSQTTDTEASEQYRDVSMLETRSSSLGMPCPPMEDSGGGSAWDHIEQMEEQAPAAQFVPYDMDNNFEVFPEENNNNNNTEKKSKKKKKKKSIKQDLETGSGDGSFPEYDGDAKPRKKSSKKSKKKTKTIKQQEQHSGFVESQ